jgi:hypothetical protein
MWGKSGSVRLCGWMFGCVLIGLLFFAAPASATFHLIKVREIYPAGTASYVELQMLENGEYQVGGHHLVLYNSDGSVNHDFTVPSNVSPASRTNATILIGGPGYEAAFSSGPTLDELDPELNLSAAGGALCWIEGEPPDCVAWGNFTGPLPAHLPTLKVGSPASPGGVTAGKALIRSIAAGCPTSLEAGDDTDNSAADFSEADPNPRDNADPIVETDCVPPTMTIETKPANPTRETSASFTFESDPAGALRECKLDGGDFEPCSYPDNESLELLGPFADGSHTFSVRGVNSQGPGPAATYTWIVDTQAPTATITASPANGSSGAEAAFTYQASQLGSAFECSLAGPSQSGIFANCPAAGKTYLELADGSYTFQVRATDKAGNKGTAASYSWQVSNSSGGGGGGGGTTLPPLSPPIGTPAPTPTPTKPLRCKKGFVKKTVKGKARCVKKKAKKKKKKH